ncbi:MAG: ABC transporter ATP-binding protein [Phycisphaerales bacterium]|nr:ABC transporter ATP-binding protein [Phycisphaerales bacterium]
MSEALLSVSDLSIGIDGKSIVSEVSFSIQRQQTLGVVGESGSGKSMTSLALIGLLPRGSTVTGSIRFKGEEIANAPQKQMRTIRGKRIAMIFQEPMSSLNPVLTVGHQLEETLLTHEQLSKKSARAQSIDAIKAVGIEAEKYGAYPHECSGGMQQRIMIAMALLCSPDVLIADEPTTALDATTSKSIIKLLGTLMKERGMSMLFISHDINSVAMIADDLFVMWNGKIVESGETQRVLTTPSHKYTKGLLACKPALDKKLRRLPTLEESMGA